LVDLQEDAVKRVAMAPELSPMQTSDAEDAITDWLEDHAMTPEGSRTWDIAPTLVAAGIDPEWMDQMAGIVGAEYLEGAIRWITYTLDTELLMSEIEDSV